MRDSSLTLIPFDLVTKKITKAIPRTNKEAQRAIQKLEEENTHISSNNEND